MTWKQYTFPCLLIRSEVDNAQSHIKEKVCTQQRYVQYKGMYMRCATPVQDNSGSALLPQLCPNFGFCALPFVFHLAPLASRYTLHRKLQKNHSIYTAEVADGCKTPVHDRNTTNLRPQLCPTLASVYCKPLITNRTREI